MPTNISGIPAKHYYPWLNDEPPIPFRYGDYQAIRRRYLPPDYLRDATPYRIAKTVYVEAEWNPQDPVGEMRYIQEMRAQYGLPTVAVAQAWLDHDDAAAVLARQAEFSFVRSVRHKPRSNRAPSDAAPGGTMDPEWRAGYGELARCGLRFDLQTPWWHLAEAARLGDRLSQHAHHPQSHRAPVRPQRRRHRRVEARDGDVRGVREHRRSRFPVSASRASGGPPRPTATSSAP